MLKKIYDNGGKYLVFFLIFNVVFLMFGLTLKYAMPFVVSLLMAVWLHPLSKLIQKKTKINKAIINIGCIILSLLFVIGAISLVGVGMFKETAKLLEEVRYVNTDFILEKFNVFKEYIDTIPPEILKEITTYAQSFVGSISVYVTTFGNWVIKVAALVPAGIISIIIIILSTYYLMRDYNLLAEKFETLKIGNSELPKQILKRTNLIIINYIQSYGILLTITFIECIIVFSIFDIKYVFTLSILCVILDIMPIIGSAIIYIPMALVFLAQGKIMQAIWIIGLYALFIVVRNIIEPKLLSKSLEIHPVLILMSIYIGVSIAGIMGVIYCIFLIAYFKLLKEVEVI